MKQPLCERESPVVARQTRTDRLILARYLDEPAWNWPLDEDLHAEIPLKRIRAVAAPDHEEEKE